MNAALLYRATGQDDKAAEAVFAAATRCFYPVAHTQILPMQIWAYPGLIALYTPEFLQRILLSDKNA